MQWKKIMLGVAVGLTVSSAAGIAGADTVVTKDGRTFVGTVTVDGDTYTIKSKFGSFEVSSDQVGEWKKDDPATTPPENPPAAPVGPMRPVRPVQVAPTNTEVAGHVLSVIGDPPADRSPAQKAAEEMINAGNNKGAISALLAVSHDSKDVRLLHALGLAYLKNHQPTFAVQMLDRAYKATDAPPRALVLNFAAAELGAKNYLKTIKVLADYLDKHGNDVDEQILNALGRSLAASDDSSRSGKVFSDAVQTYTTANTALEATHQGEKRYGEKWYPADVADAMNKSLADAAQKLSQAIDQAHAADQQMASAQQAQNQANSMMGKYINRGAVDMNAQIAARNQQDAYNRVNQARPAAQSPFPTNLDPVSLDAVLPGPGSQTTVASSDPPAVVAPRVQAPVIPPVVVANNDPPQKPVVQEPVAPAEPPKLVAPVDEKPQMPESAAAFPVGDQILVTSAAVVKDATDITVEGGDGIAIKAKLLRLDEASGLALIQLSNVRLNFLALAEKFAGGKFDCPGYDQVDLFNTKAKIMPGTAPEPGEKWTLTFEQRPKLWGSPLVVNGEVVGVELGGDDIEPNKSAGVTLDALKKFVGSDLPNAPSNNPDPATTVMKVNVTRG